MANTTGTLDIIIANSANNGGIEKFSDFILRDNPLQAGEALKQDRNMYWRTLFDYQMEHPEVLQGTVTRYITDIGDKVMKPFPLRKDVRGRWKQTTIEFTRNVLRAGTRKVPFREISYTTSTTERTAMYTGEGFEGDYQGLKTPEGMALFDLLFSQVMSDIMRVLVYNMYNTFMTEPSAYNVANMRFPFESVIPDTPQKALTHFYSTQFLALNKECQSISNLIAAANRMFEAAGQPRVALIVMSSDVEHHIRANDESNTIFEQTGPSALANRDANQRAEPVGSIRGIEVLTIQMLGTDNHNPWNGTIFTDYVQTGGLARWIEPSVYGHPSKYKSEDRVARWSSWYSDKPEDHSPLDGWKHCMEFVGMDYKRDEDDEEDVANAGDIDYRLLEALARSAMNTKTGPYARTKCRLRGNEHMLHQFLHFHAGTVPSTNAADVDRWYPILMFGEIDNKHYLKDNHLRMPYGTMQERIVGALTEEDISAIEAGVALAKMLNASANRIGTYFHMHEISKDPALGTGLGVDPAAIPMIKEFVGAFEKLVTVLLEHNENNFGLDPEMIPNIYAAQPLFTRICIAAWFNIVAPKTNIAPRTGTAADPFGSRVSGAQPDDVLFSFQVLENFGAPGNTVTSPIFTTAAVREAVDHLNSESKNILGQLWGAPPMKNECFAKRALASLNTPLWEGIAQRTVLLQRINLFGIQKWWDHNIAVPLGLSMFRIWEDMQTDSLVMTSEKQTGFTAYSGIDNILAFDAGSQHYECFGFGHFRTIVVNNKGFVVMDRVRARRVLGGKGNRYVNADPDAAMGSVMRVGSKHFDEVIRTNFGNGELYGAYGMLAVLDGYSNSIENPFGERILPVTGFWDERDFVGLVNNSYSFQTEYPKPLCTNQFLLNHVFPELILNKSYSEGIRMRTPSHEEISQSWRHNTIVNQITQWVKNPLTGGWDEIQSSHPCGREEEGIREIQSSITPVRRSPRKQTVGFAPQALGNMRV